MKEANSGRIKVKDVGPAAVKRTLDFMYTGKLFSTREKEPATDDVLIELLHCADKYEITNMKPSVLVKMKEILSTPNALKFANAAELYRVETSFREEYLGFCKK